jgi:hypothetical protein
MPRAAPVTTTTFFGSCMISLYCTANGSAETFEDPGP